MKVVFSSATKTLRHKGSQNAVRAMNDALCMLGSFEP